VIALAICEKAYCPVGPNDAIYWAYFVKFFESMDLLNFAKLSYPVFVSVAYSNATFNLFALVIASFTSCVNPNFELAAELEIKLDKVYCKF